MAIMAHRNSADYLEHERCNIPGCQALNFRFMFLVFLAVAPISTSLAAWDYGTILDIGVIRSDNLFLEADDSKLSDVVYTIAPEFYLENDSERLTVNFRYKPEGIFYSEFNNQNDVFHALDASLTAALIHERLYLDLSAINFQSITTPDGVFPTTNLPISANRVDSRILEVKPFWKQQFSAAELLIEVAYVDVAFDDSNFQGSSESKALFSLNNISRQQGISWDVDYSYRRMEYDISAPFDFERASLGIGYWITRSARIFAVGGGETSITNIFEGGINDDFWEAGVQLSPNQRLNIEVATGRRSYGESFRGMATYTLRRGQFSFSYNEGLSTRGEVIFDRRPVTGTDNLDNFLDRPGNSDRFLSKRGELKIGIDLAKSNLTLRIFSEDRSIRTTADGIPLDGESYAGAVVRWNWQFGSKTAFGASVDIAERDILGRTDELTRYQVDLSYSFSSRLSTRLEFAQSKQDSVQATNLNYTENVVRLFVRTEF